MDYNFWDDRTHELEINPCEECSDYQNGECISNGGCAKTEADDNDVNKSAKGNTSFSNPYDDSNWDGE